MTIDERLRSAGERLNAELEQVTVPQVPRRRNPVWRALTVAAAVVAFGVVFGVAAWLLASPDELAEVVDEGPATTQASPDSVTRHPQELVPTAVHLLTSGSEFLCVTADADGLIWAAGWEHVARIDPVTGDTRVWDQRDDVGFADDISGLAPARGGGVWMIQPDRALRWFDGERFRDVVETRSLAPTEGIEAVVEAPDGTLFASLSDRGVFRWDGSSWGPLRGGGAGALSMDAAGALWVGDLEVLPGQEEGEPDRLIGRGVSRYDGEDWVTFTTADSTVLSEVALTIDELADGTVWVVTEAGIARFDGVGWSDVTTGGPPLGSRSGWGRPSAGVGPDGTVWVATADDAVDSDGGVGPNPVAVAGFDGTAWSVYGPEAGLPAESRWIVATPIATEDGVFVGTGAGVYRLAGDRWTRVLPRPEEAPPGASEGASLVGVHGMRASGGYLWVWGGGEIWRYGEGRWSFYSGTPDGAGDIWDMAFGGGTLWVLADGVFSFEGDGWTELTAAPAQAWRIEADPRTGILWLSTGPDLYRWDGEDMVNVGHPAPSGSGAVGDEYGVHDIAVTTDGSVWAAGLYGWVPQWGSLARYDDDTGTWEVVRPLGGDEGIPASLLAATPNGGLWVMLADWPSPESGDGGEAAMLTLARHESVTGDWIVYDEDPPEGYPMAMASGGDSVWLAQGGVGVEGFAEVPGIIRFDGLNWTTYLVTPVDEPVPDIGVADDGTIWYLHANRLYLLDPEIAATEG
jgi:hypothetical protein